MPLFECYVGIDYSGAKTPDCSLNGLRIYRATPSQPPVEIPPPPGRRRYWTRRGIAAWLSEQLKSGPPTLVGLDHGFSFPLRYFDTHGLPHDWDAFLEDFHRHWPTDDRDMYVDFLRGDPVRGLSQRAGDARWRRLTEVCCGAKSVFHFDVQGSVAKSTHSGLPWLHHLRRELGNRLHFWPFDGWTPPAGISVIAEVYPSLCNRTYPAQDRDPHQHDAYSVARWMRETDATGSWTAVFEPELELSMSRIARVEGWILGLPYKKPSIREAPYPVRTSGT